MKDMLLLTLLATSVYFYHQSKQPAAPPKPAVVQSAQTRVKAKDIVVAPAPSYKDRWTTGAEACTTLKTGPNAQVTFEPFLLDAQANWNPNPGYTIVSGYRMR